jgi:hypothetical protein
MPLLLLTNVNGWNKEWSKYTRTFYVRSVVVTAAILMTAGVASSALITPNQVIASIDNTIEEEE